MDQVAFVEDGLELQGVARIVGPPVQVEIDESVLRGPGNTAPVATDGNIFAPAHPDIFLQLRLEAVVGPVVRQELGHRGRQARETLGRNALRRDDLVPLAEDQPAGIHWLAGDVIRHIESETVSIQPLGQG